VVQTAVRTVVKNTNCSDGGPDRQCDPAFTGALVEWRCAPGSLLISRSSIVFVWFPPFAVFWPTVLTDILVRPPGCVWYVGVTQDSEDPIHPPHNQWWSPVPPELTAALQHRYKQTAPFLRSHRPQLSWRRSPSCHCCRDTQASSGLEKARRETQLHLVTFGGGRPETSEHWSFFCVEKTFWAGGLAPHRGHGYAPEEYATKRSTNGHAYNTKLYLSVVVFVCCLWKIGDNTIG